MKESFVAPGERRTHVFTMRGTIPLRCRGHGAGVRREAHEHGVRAVLLADKLTDIQLAPLAHLGGPGIAEMGVVRPHDNARARLRPVEKAQELLKGVHHVAIAKVPRVGTAPEHRPVVLFRVPDQARVLLGVEELVGCHTAVAARVLGALTVQLEELGDDFPFARGMQAEAWRRCRTPAFPRRTDRNIRSALRARRAAISVHLVEVNAFATRRSRNRRSSAPASARRSAACGRSSR